MAMGLCIDGARITAIQPSSFLLSKYNSRSHPLAFGYKHVQSCTMTRRSCQYRAQLKEENNEASSSTPSSAPDRPLVSDDRHRDGDLQQNHQDWGWLPAFPHVVTASMANFLFGYHIGIINGPIKSIALDLGFDGDTIMEGLVVSIFIVGAFFGSLGGGPLADRVGRRKTFQIAMIPLLLGPALSAAALSVDWMLLGRFLVGIGIGVNTAAVPLYISEVSPTKYRGALGTICQIGTCVGIIVALLVGIPAETDMHWWRIMFWISTIPAIFIIIAMEFAVESPRWLGKTGQWDDARKVIGQLWGQSQVEQAMEELQNANEFTAEDEASWGELFSQRNFSAAAIGGSLFVFQQFAGINGVLYFSSLTFHDAGVSNSITASAAVGVVNLIGALTALSLMDKQGRRILLIGSYAGMAIAMFGVVFGLELPIGNDWSHIVSVSCTLIYIFCFALGAGPVTGLIIPEICSTKMRAKTMAFSFCVHWVCNFIVGLFFLEVVNRFGLSAVYGSFGVVSIITAVFAYYCIIETKGKSLEEIEFLMNSDMNSFRK